MTNKPSIDELWLEYRVASQFCETWDRAEDAIELIRRKEMGGTLPTQDDLAGPSSFSSRKGSPAKWMSMVYAPDWFSRDELGHGSRVNYWSTQATLEKTNAGRRRKHKDMVAQLAAAAKSSVIKRTYRT